MAASLDDILTSILNTNKILSGLTLAMQNLSTTNPTTLKALASTATTAGGYVTPGLALGTAALGVYFGSGAPTISAPQGSLYLRTDGSSTTTRAYINTNGSTTWTSIATAA